MVNKLFRVCGKIISGGLRSDVRIATFSKAKLLLEMNRCSLKERDGVEHMCLKPGSIPMSVGRFLSLTGGSNRHKFLVLPSRCNTSHAIHVVALTDKSKDESLGVAARV